MTELETPLSPARLRELPVLTLAYFGDSVWELMVRNRLARTGAKPGRLNAIGRSFVSAPAQAGALERLTPLLLPEEAELVRRGRNTRVGCIPKGAEAEEYHAATGLECLMGALWLQGDRARAEELFRMAFPEE